jgi:AmmeMemoRadiSam system protein B/AmmeMemoRadiSam system protein A
MNDLLTQQAAHGIRQPVVEGLFYPGDPEELGATVDHLLDRVPGTKISEPLIALISPHASYPYSGPVAAWAYALLKNRRVRRVVVISPCHVEMFRGSAVFKGNGYATPLGVIPVDQDFSKKLASTSSLIEHSDRGHRAGPQGRGEHALEVQLPFLQRVLDDFLLVPVVMGEQNYEACRALAVALAELIKGPETLIVASSDLSHFHSYGEAVERDQKVLRAIERWDYLTLSRNLDLRVWEACGGGPIVAAMVAAERLGAVKATVLKYANSGDVPPGDKSRVVGYGAVALYGSQGSGKLVLDTIQLNEAEKSELLRISKESVAESVAGNELTWNPEQGSANLRREAAVFVTLKKQGQLRGCVGSIVPVKSLGAAVAAAAHNAAVNDPRFPPVTSDELRRLSFEISVLSPFRRIRDIEQIEIGEHGLLIEKGRAQGLLLPQVASERNWDQITFLEQVCVKAGLAKEAWKDEEADIFVFSATVFGESN